MSIAGWELSGHNFYISRKQKVKRDNGGKKGKWRNMNKEPMDKDNRGED